MLEPVLKNPWVRAVGVLAGLLLLILMGYLLSAVLVPLFFAFIVAYMFNPVVELIEKHLFRRWKNKDRARTVGTAVVTITLLLLVLSFPLIVLPSMYTEAQHLIDSAAQDINDKWLNEILDRLPLKEFVIFMQWAPEPEPARPIESISRAEEGVWAPIGLDTKQELVLRAAPDTESGEMRLSAQDVAAPKTLAGPKLEGEPDLPPEDEVKEEEEDGFDERAILAEKIGQLVKDNAVQLIRTQTQSLAAAGQRAGASAMGIFASLSAFIMNIVLLVGNLALFAFVTIYLLKDYERLIEGTDRLIPPRHREKVHEIMHRIDLQLRSFLRGQLMVCACLGTMYAVGMKISGVPFAIPIAIFGALASFIPYAGLVLTMLLATVLTLLQYGFDWHFAGMLLTFFIAQQLEGNFLTPKILGSQVGLSPVWVILAIMVFSSALGFLGLLLAVPIAAVLKVLVSEGVELYKKSVLFEGPPPEAPAS